MLLNDGLHLASVAQSAVIPFRVRRAQVEIALVTSSSGTRWTIPKGHLEPNLAPHESAAKEAFEEAGLLGRVSSEQVGAYVYQKRGRARHVDVFPLRVTRTLGEWPEMNRRQRRWVSPEVAASMVLSAELRCCIQRFADRVAAAAGWV